MNLHDQDKLKNLYGNNNFAIVKSIPRTGYAYRWAGQFSSGDKSAILFIENNQFLIDYNLERFLIRYEPRKQEDKNDFEEACHPKDNFLKFEIKQKEYAIIHIKTYNTKFFLCDLEENLENNIFKCTKDVIPIELHDLIEFFNYSRMISS